MIFEVCAETLGACSAAREGGAQRIELCSALSEGGLTPSHALLQAAIQQSGLPVHVLLRPRGGGFVYTENEFALIEEDLAHARVLGVSGFVAGALSGDGRVDCSRMRRLVELASPLEVTFHRAFDEANDLELALEDVIATGCRRLLTSGGALNVHAGAERLRELQKQAAGRIAIAAGGGLRPDNALEAARVSGLTMFHGSLGSQNPTADAVRGMIALLEQGAAV